MFFLYIFFDNVCQKGFYSKKEPKKRNYGNFSILKSMKICSSDVTIQIFQILKPENILSSLIYDSIILLNNELNRCRNKNNT